VTYKKLFCEKLSVQVKKHLAALYILLINPSLVFAQVAERFPKPDFQSEYTRPLMQSPVPRSQFLEYFDLFVLIAALSLASYFALKLRSRTKMFLLMVFSLLYFGFFRKGCICPVGSVQNVSLALFNSAYTIPLTVIDVRPWIAQVLGVIPYMYLGLAVLFASTGAGFIICQYDPFVGFFRFGASFNMIALGISLLILGTVVARPYCRFLCPYGVILNWMSRLSKWHVTITPSECINCRLCEESCPFGAINIPVDEKPVNRGKSIRHLAVLFILLPVIVAGSGWVFSRLSVPLSNQHFTVSLAEKIQAGNSGGISETTEETDAFRSSGKTVDELFTEALIIRHKFRTGGWILGGFIGLIFCVKLIGLTILRRRTDYTIDTGNCFSCARCFSYCPVEQVRLGNMDPDEVLKIKKTL